jgi:hypothetical protein
MYLVFQKLIYLLESSLCFHLTNSIGVPKQKEWWGYHPIGTHCGEH